MQYGPKPTDMLGTEVRNGDYIARGVRMGNSGDLQLYKIIDVDNMKALKLVGGYSINIKTVTFYHWANFVIIDDINIKKLREIENAKTDND